MTIQEQMKKDLAQAMKDRDEAKKSALRVVMGEFGRAETKVLSDDVVVKILKKLIKSETETLTRQGKPPESPYIDIIASYIPKMADADEIRGWIAEHIDFSAYKNRMQAMKDIMAHFGARADGGRVKEILQQDEG